MSTAEQVELFTRGLSIGEQVASGQSRGWKPLALNTWDAACGLVREAALGDAMPWTVLA